MLAIDHLKSCKGGGGEVVNTCPINTWQWWLARAHSRGWAVRTMRLTLQMRQLAEVMGRNQSILLVLTLAAEGSMGTGWLGWDGLKQALARPARGAVRVRRLGSLTSTSIERGMENIVRHCHGHQEIITDASMVELRFHSKSSFPLEQLEINAWRGETKAGPARSEPETHGTADPSIRF